MSFLESSSGDWDEDGFHFWVRDDEGVELRVRIIGTETARDLLKAVEPLREWVAEHDHEYAAYLIASPEERARVIGHVLVGDDPEEMLREAADLDRKARKERGE